MEKIIEDILDNIDEIKANKQYLDEIKQERENKNNEKNALKKENETYGFDSLVRQSNQESIDKLDGEIQKLDETISGLQNEVRENLDSKKVIFRAEIEEKMKLYKLASEIEVMNNEVKELEAKRDEYKKNAAEAKKTYLNEKELAKLGKSVDPVHSISVIDNAKKEEKENIKLAEELDAQINSKNEEYSKYIKLEDNKEEYIDLEHLLANINSLNADRLDMFEQTIENFSSKYIKAEPEIQQEEIDSTNQEPEVTTEEPDQAIEEEEEIEEEKEEKEPVQTDKSDNEQEKLYDEISKAYQVAKMKKQNAIPNNINDIKFENPKQSKGNQKLARVLFEINQAGYPNYMFEDELGKMVNIPKIVELSANERIDYSNLQAKEYKELKQEIMEIHNLDKKQIKLVDPFLIKYLENIGQVQFAERILNNIKNGIPLNDLVKYDFKNLNKLISDKSKFKNIARSAQRNGSEVNNFKDNIFRRIMNKLRGLGQAKIAAREKALEIEAGEVKPEGAPVTEQQIKEATIGDRNTSTKNRIDVELEPEQSFEEVLQNKLNEHQKFAQEISVDNFETKGNEQPKTDDNQKQVQTNKEVEENEI